MYKDLKDKIHKKLMSPIDGRLPKFTVISKNEELKNIVDCVIRETSFLDSNTPLKARVYCVLSDITSRPLCLNKECSNQPPFRNMSSGFNATCSPRCRYEVLPSPMKGKTFSSESIEKLKKSLKGKTPWNKGKTWNDETKKKLRGQRPAISGERHPNYGKELSNDTKHRISTSLKNTFSKKSSSFFREINIKGNKTKKQNGTFNTSQLEDSVYCALVQHYPDIKRGYQSKEYPYLCDFFIPSLMLYIELQGSWTHGGRAFNPNRKEDKEKLYLWKEKAKASQYYKNAIYVWTDLDVRKRQHATDTKINFLEIFDFCSIESILQQIDRVVNGLSFSYTSDSLREEIFSVRSKEGAYDSLPIYNKTIVSKQPHMFSKEHELWKNPILRRRLIENRVHYLSKKESEISDSDLLRGFKRSGIYKGYSYFSPLWIKRFIEEYNISSLYDPCGGWGHRLLGCWNIFYHYNDTDARTCLGVKDMWDSYGGEEYPTKIFTQEDAAIYTPKHRYEAVFTCPPYFNKEKYSFPIVSSYEQWIQGWWKGVVQNSSKNCDKYFSYVTSPSLLCDMDLICREENLTFIKHQPLGNSKRSHFGSSYQDILSIFSM